MLNGGLPLLLVTIGLVTTVVSLGFLAPLLALRFSVYFAFIATAEKFPSPIEIWRKTKGNGFALLGGIVFLLLVSLFLAQTFFIPLPLI